MRYYKCIALLLLFKHGFSNPPEIMVGDKMPNLKFNIINYRYEKKNSTIKDFAGKFIILDFWATWCIPCVRDLKKLDSIQKRNEDKLQIILVTKEDKALVASLFRQIKNIRDLGSLVSVVNDKELNSAFPHNTLPHLVWIDTNWVVRAITDVDQLTEGNIKWLLENRLPKLPVKRDFQAKVGINTLVPLFSQPNLPLNNDAIIQYSILTRYNPELISGVGGGGPVEGRPYGYGMNKIMITNHTPLALFKFAYWRELGNFSNSSRIILESKDSLQYTYGSHWTMDRMRDWNKDNAVCYDLQVRVKDTSRFFEIMQRDLENYFPLKATLEEKRITSLEIEFIGKNKIITKGGESSRKANQYSFDYKNIPISTFITDLQILYQGKQVNILNATGYHGNIDLNLNTDVSDIKLLNEELEKYNLEAVEKVGDITVLVIRDK